MKVIADGDLTSTVEGTIRRDELGSMARAVQIFKDNELGARDRKGCRDNSWRK
ncbi:HAMP domain-containing protein [Rhizobium leguminosarum]|nr:HAMP domain-containing protein [Rhizobium leguminosarum]